MCSILWLEGEFCHWYVATTNPDIGGQRVVELFSSSVSLCWSSLGLIVREFLSFTRIAQEDSRVSFVHWLMRTSVVISVGTSHIWSWPYDEDSTSDVSWVLDHLYIICLGAAWCDLQIMDNASRSACKGKTQFRRLALWISAKSIINGKALVINKRVSRPFWILLNKSCKTWIGFMDVFPQK